MESTKLHFTWFLSLCLIDGGFLWPPALGQTWVEDTFEDFADGKLDASGQNLYVSRDGTVRTIHRFDLNQDGYLDLIFNSTHDNYSFIPATLAAVTPTGQIGQSPLAVEGSKQVAIEDLNRDGYPDLVFCPNNSGIQHPRRFLTIIWGGLDGWPPHRSNGVLPVHGVLAVAVADLNLDQWPDIVALNGEAWLPDQPVGHIIRIFWGGEQGYLSTKRHDVGVPEAIALVAADLDSNGGDDVAVLTESGSVRLLWATSQGDKLRIPVTDISLPRPGTCMASADCDRDGHTDLVVGTNHDVVYLLPGAKERSFTAPRTIRTSSASHITLGELDGDGWPDLVLTRLAIATAGGGELVGAGVGTGDQVRIFWGGQDGFLPSRSDEIRVEKAAASSIGNLNGDGYADLAIAVYQSSETFHGDSRIFFGKGNRQLEEAPGQVRTEGANHVAILPPIGSSPGHAIFCNSRGGSLDEKVPLHVYWGGAEGFDVGQRWEIPFSSGYEASAADLNVDGYVDLVALNSGHVGEAAQRDPHLGANIFWGRPAFLPAQLKQGFGPVGFDLSKRTVLRENNLGSSTIGDLNRDGYLDLVLGAFEGRKGYNPLTIYYGSPRGYHLDNRRSLLSEGRSLSPITADFDRDQWLDIAVVSTMTNLLRIFWGGPEGFDESRQDQLPVPFSTTLEVADLNADGYLDLTAGTYYDPGSHHHDTGLFIFWGSSKGFRSWNAQWLPGFTPVGITVADFDGDGFLDLFSPHYHGELTRESLPSYLYWGGPEGFATRHRSLLITDSAHDALAGDFDRDGLLDLAVSCHTKDGDHYTSSKVFFNDGQRFAHPRTLSLPTHGPHWMWDQDMGHIYDRTWSQSYESSLFSWKGQAKEAHIDIQADLPQGTGLTLAIRSASKDTDLEKKSWTDIEKSSFPLSRSDRCLQYRATFSSDNGDRFPVLDQVTISLVGSVP